MCGRLAGMRPRARHFLPEKGDGVSTRFSCIMAEGEMQRHDDVRSRRICGLAR